MAIRSLKNGTFSRSLLIGNAFYEPPNFNLIQTYTLSSAQSSVTFSSIPSTYAHLQLRIMAKTTQTGDSDFILGRFNSDSGSNYNEHALYGTGASASAMYNPASGCIWQRIATDQHNANTFGVIIVDILDYANTNKYTTVRNLGAFDDNGSGQIYFESNLWRNTAAITSITMTNSTLTKDFKQYSRFSLYGISE